MPELLTRASHCFFTGPLDTNMKMPSSSKAILILLFALYLEPSLSLLPHSQAPAGGHFTEGHQGWVRPLPAAWCGFAWLTLGWGTALCGFAYWDSPCSRMYFTISLFPVMAAWCNKEQWSGPWINKLAPFLQHSMNWKEKKIKKRERKKTYGRIRWEE